METAVGHVQTQLSPDEALAKLYGLLTAKNAPKPGSFTSLNADQKREYFRLSRQRSRARMRAASSVAANAANINQALSDAALMILATDAPGADQVRKVLQTIFELRPGVPISVENRAKQGKLKPKLIARSE
ncbi:MULTISPECIES: hypothetical protein [unclassified Mesorhizobium]|uniref:hypothetical protein n=1 Tax=unclassified Mesorhizobium TaxID=325217 RepID=UPI000FCAB37B|nr:MULTISPECIES: hypothetical protein [unclassified Mesorhizobium]RUV99361.1 hypothetical protein EOA49_20180 [Mesorhizobium sp. M1A.F.Ca.IN.020.04.1.1]RUW16288.1 hypothetical protein EOA53_00625 [Mesorhizobium sp. M1A.F.Ca.IN.020.03.1.1]RWF75281.1 MAG: hypothetical protein EOQ34_02215 [Mesorhizobium sp.]RWG15842.1 MAG: hypothetical protein EOQ58_10545 [Mesorhizobium sp.]RWG31418.1 MAG: hypothetical protein EOQ61_13480 [Mesorhizobium sp.]